MRALFKIINTDNKVTVVEELQYFEYHEDDKHVYMRSMDETDYVSSGDVNKLLYDMAAKDLLRNDYINLEADYNISFNIEDYDEEDKE